VDYRVRAVPEARTRNHSRLFAREIVKELERDANASDRNATWWATELSAPVQGIPRRVFEQASQARLLEKARQKIERSRRAGYSPSSSVVALLERHRPTTSPAGRPATRGLGQKLAILAAVEDAFCDGRTLQDVADDQHVSRSTVRDIVSWGRRHEPQLFTSVAVAGQTGGQLTDAGRALLAKRERP
jgi:hypothetical protein